MTRAARAWLKCPGLASVLILFSGCAGSGAAHGPFGSDDPETPIKIVALPSVVPTVHRLQFDDPGDGSLSNPRGAAPAGAVSSTKLDGPTNQSALVTAAVGDSRVKTALGERFRLIQVDRVESGKAFGHGCCDHRGEAHRLIFYSYSNKTTVDVLMKGSQIASVAARPGYQPPETQEEAEEAIALVRADSRLAGKLEGLDGHVILTEPGEGLIWNDPGYGHRTLWVTFSKGIEGRPLYWALVDMDERAVLKAKEEPQN